MANLTLERTPYTKIGKDVSAASTAQEALQTAGISFEVGRMPLWVPSLKLQVPDAFGVFVLSPEDGKPLPGGFLATVGTEWTPCQNSLMADLLQEVAGQGGKPTSGGTPNGGKTCWLSYQVGEVRIADDFVKGFVTAINGFDGGSALKIIGSEMKVFCSNQFSSLLKEGNLLHSFRHSGTIQERVKAATALIRLERTRLERMKVLAETLLKVPFSQARYEGLVEALLPLPEDFTARQKTNNDEKRAFLWDCISSPDLANIVSNGWGAVQAVAEYATHLHPVKDDSNKTQTRHLQNLSGSPLVGQAREFILAP